MWEYIKFLHFKYWTHGWDGLGPLLMWNPDIIEVAEPPPKTNWLRSVFGVAEFFVFYLPLVFSGLVLSLVIGIPAYLFKDADKSWLEI